MNSSSAPQSDCGQTRGLLDYRAVAEPEGLQVPPPLALLLRSDLGRLVFCQRPLPWLVPATALEKGSAAQPCKSEMHGSRFCTDLLPPKTLHVTGTQLIPSIE